MLIACAWCGKVLGEKEPLEDKSPIHGICNQCLNRYFPHQADQIRLALSVKNIEKIYGGARLPGGVYSVLRQLPIELPKSFEEALGYPGKSRWAAFYWEPCGDESEYDDGIVAGTGNCWGFLAFVRHPKVNTRLAGYNLGSSDEEAEHWLLGDLESRELYVGTKKEVSDFLNEEAKKVLPEPLAIKPEDDSVYDRFREAIMKAEKAFREMPVPSIAEIEEKMRRDQEVIDSMVKELE